MGEESPSEKRASHGHSNRPFPHLRIILLFAIFTALIVTAIALRNQFSASFRGIPTCPERMAKAMNTTVRIEIHGVPFSDALPMLSSDTGILFQGYNLASEDAKRLISFSSKEQTIATVLASLTAELKKSSVPYESSSTCCGTHFVFRGPEAANPKPN